MLGLIWFQKMIMNPRPTVVFLPLMWVVFVISAVPPDLYIGCYRDNGERDMPALWLNNANNTPAICIEGCAAKGFLFAGVQHSDCFCGNSYGKLGKISENGCKLNCLRNTNLKCGGDWANSIYLVAIKLSQFIGCYLESLPRDLWGDQSALSGLLSAQDECIQRCKAKGFHFAAINNYTLCSCGINYGRYGKASNTTDCNPRCSRGEHCSHIDANSIFRTMAADLYLGCFIDVGNSFDLAIVAGRYLDNTPITCCARCRARGYRYCGLQASDWCFCDDSYGKHGKAPESDCSSACKGDPGIICGGPYRNSIYAVESTVKPPPYITAVYSNTENSPPLSRDHVMYTETSVPDGSTCVQYCELSLECVSINYNPVAMVCEMNNVTSSVGTAVVRKGFFYSEPMRITHMSYLLP
ncbi:WSC domain-containing protein ARB_07867 [Nematostella vectensis]|uniref:WSC domain-containing protein ARB_07867 n=1 Tax=Nematostella vectensis TaxID=45351 RepID=UPI0020778B9C|nr:WSC domain-containing protein ARB_07867 [Nematostella vectensis]